MPNISATNTAPDKESLMEYMATVTVGEGSDLEEKRQRRRK